MSFKRKVSEKLKKSLKILKRKDKSTFIALDKKMRQIVSCDNLAIVHFKNLRHDSSEYRRIQVGSFVLIFKVKGDTIIFEKFTHHDRAY
ncbi:MAG: hypothetical protein U9Q69_05305 [Nanoarchaeota archaeon]|nr:hypothetical protein [Nanoarchaeota archaeon]